MIELGQKVRDKVSGLKGVAMGRADYLYRTPTVLVAPESLDSTGKRFTAEWIEEAQLEVIDDEEKRTGFR